MANIIDLAESREDLTIRKLEDRHRVAREELRQLEDQLEELKPQIWDFEAELQQAVTAPQKKQFRDGLAELKKAEKLLRQEIDLKREQTDSLRRDITAYTKTTAAVDKQEQSRNNVIEAMERLNANYVASDSRWYCIYDNGCRYQPQVRIVSNETMRDLILRETGWTERNEDTIKSLARDAGRMYRDVERTFLPHREGVLNQLNELRKFWLKPIYGREPHPAFDLLFSNLVDGDAAYKDQIERYIAYRYVRPDDIFAPNIDSSAKGGAGRDTVFRILEIIFTEECCGEANGETFTGTHNGELWGKVWVKISERNARSIDYNEFKNLTGGHNFRLRRMGENAVQSPRTFLFFIMNNGYNGTIQLAGTGKGSEDRRVEPIISNTSLRTRIAEALEVDENEEIVAETIQDWQQNVWQNEERIAEWLGHIIERHKPMEIVKISPLHGQYYDQMFERQKNAFNTFMETVVKLTQESNCFVLDDLHKIYKIATNQTIDKNAFGKRVCSWMTQQSGQNWQIKVRDIYYDTYDDERHRRSVIYMPDSVVVGSKSSKQIFNIYEYIDQDKKDDKGNELNRRPHVNNIRGDLL
jgi:hypothetical protein